jgi:pantoate--beta-alanine ligase
VFLLKWTTLGLIFVVLAKLKTLITLQELQEFRQDCRNNNQSLAFVPTMGALHRGHISLVKTAQQQATRVIVSIFVNPLQFGPNEDFARYPRTLSADMEMLGSGGVDAVFVPNIQEVYPPGSQSRVNNPVLSDQLCGAFRPGHFEGVLTVVMKLFGMVQPDAAIFGKKDYQQFQMISQMVRDFSLPITIVGGETIRDESGLALSSRNRYLSADDLPHARTISAGLKAAKDAFVKGERNPKTLEEIAQNIFSQQLITEYVSVRTQRGMESCGDKISAAAVILAAVKLGQTRLIDNMELNLDQ